ncbi:transcriptional regulator, TetR family [Terribacillus aidingensis]|uniref:Transcriptional regulator, TetR family n=1 Tax=Terribacillus aidingensis TaxID=586416 RepID=A0A285N1M7_9BACI|nr:TetR/AcrR family transcriptional regulator [Terribacillus aidingensis]SNZ03340.1 transcriptional regulator, TetR family [Terribacillus aidingensis]
MNHSQSPKHLLIKKRLLLSARELFRVYGLKKTSIAELTKAVGIAQGSFYAYFSSKEELFFELVEVEEGRIKEELFHLLQEEPMTKHLFKKFLLKSLELIQQNPIIRSLFDKEHMQYLLNKLPPERMEKHIKVDTESLRPMIEHLQQQNIMIKKDPRIISGIIRSFILSFLHQQTIGEDIFEETIALHAEMIADGLIQGG